MACSSAEIIIKHCRIWWFRTRRFCICWFYVLIIGAMLSRITIKSFSLVRTKSFPSLRYYRSSHLIPLNVKEDLLQYEFEFTSISNSPAVIDHIQGLASKYPEIISSVETYRKLYPFPLDDFQLNGLQSLIDGKSVIVMTPTGSGKTVVGELAIYYALMKGLRVAYTSPLKALSNQKYVDFKRKFGAERVGLMTGDVTINRDAPIIIMTTEVFRNMVYSPEKSNVLTNLFMVCLDEFHYMNDAERGTVWEESVISCPSSVRLLALSATMGNVEEIHSWISTIHGPTDLIRSDYRPVPLRYYFSSKSGLLPLFIDPKSGPGAKNGVKRDQHGKLISKSCINPSITHLLQKASRVQKRGNLEGNKQRKNEGEKLHRLIPKYSEVARELMKMQKLPAIFFIFSRIGCLEAATEVLQSNLKLLSKDESKFVKNALDQFMKTHPTIPISRQHSHLLQAGVGVHHAGLIPVWKSFIEELFNANMIKVLFATETLAAGISARYRNLNLLVLVFNQYLLVIGVNMPARSTVISAVSKRVDSQTVKLKTSQLLQMAGRAGRRGKDVEGSVVIMHNRVEDPSTSHRLLTSSIDGIKSHFRTSYGITAKLLQKKDIIRV
jgi:superfamily II RNA helicase